MKQFDYTITEKEGIHARPAGLLIKEAKKFQSSLILEGNEKSADLKKILAVMALGIKKGTKIKVKIDGEDEVIAAESIKLFFEQNL